MCVQNERCTEVEFALISERWLQAPFSFAFNDTSQPPMKHPFQTLGNRHNESNLLNTFRLLQGEKDVKFVLNV